MPEKAQIGWRVGALLLGGLAALGGCVSSEDLEMVRRDTLSVRKEVAGLAKANESARAFTEERLTKLETDFRTRFESTLKESEGSRAALGSRLDDMATETRLVQGKLEENAFVLSNLNSRLDEMDQQGRLASRRMGSLEQQMKNLGQQVQGIEQQIRALSQPSPVAPPPGQIPGQLPGGASLPGQPPPGQPSTVQPPGGQAPAAPPPATALTPQPPSGPATRPPTTATPPQGPVAVAPTAPPRPPAQVLLPPEEVYRNALDDYTKGNYDLAIAGFRTYIQNYPKTSLVPNAQYWLGESYYSQKNFAQAVEEFDIVIREFPESPKVPSALFKQGDAYKQIGDAKRETAALCELVTKYPKTREARLARDRNVRCR